MLVSGLKGSLRSALRGGLGEGIFTDTGGDPNIYFHPTVATAISSVVDATLDIATGPVVFNADTASASAQVPDHFLRVRGVIGVTALTSSSSTTNATSYASASISPTANRLIIASVSVFNSGAAASTPTLSGAGMTWTQVATVASGATSQRRVTVFRALSASPGSGAVTIDLGGVTHESAAWSFVEFSNVDTSGTNGSGAVVQSDTDTSGTTNVTTHAALSLAAFENFANMCYCVTMLQANNAVTPGTGFTEISDAGQATDTIRQQDEYKLADTTPDPSWTSTVAAGIAIEIMAA